MADAVGAAVAWDPARGEPASRPGHPPEPPAVVVRGWQGDGQDIQQAAEQKEPKP